MSPIRDDLARKGSKRTLVGFDARGWRTSCEGAGQEVAEDEASRQAAGSGTLAASRQI